MQSIVSILLALAACSVVTVHGRRATGQQHLRSTGSMSSASGSASSTHHSNALHPNYDNVYTYSCDVSALAARKPAEGDRLRKGEILHSAKAPLVNALSKNSTKVYVQDNCKLVISGKDKSEIFGFGRD